MKLVNTKPVVDQLTDMICDPKDEKDWQHNYDIVWNLLLASVGSNMEEFERLFLTDMDERNEVFETSTF